MKKEKSEPENRMECIITFFLSLSFFYIQNWTKSVFDWELSFDQTNILLVYNLQVPFIVSSQIRWIPKKPCFMLVRCVCVCVCMLVPIWMMDASTCVCPTISAVTIWCHRTYQLITSPLQASEHGYLSTMVEKETLDQMNDRSELERRRERKKKKRRNGGPTGTDTHAIWMTLSFDQYEHHTHTQTHQSSIIHVQVSSYIGT